MALDLQFLEIEHKFLIDPDRDVKPLLDRLHKHQPERFIQTDVEDTYFLVQHVPSVVYRHRIDSYLQQLTVKNLTNDTEVRLEVNLDLNSSQNQIDSIRAFLAPLGLLWHGSLRKNVQAFYFQDAELVYYEAVYNERKLRCLEIEARRASSIDHAQKILADWENFLGLDPLMRSHDSLLDLLIVPSLPRDLQQNIRRL